MGVGQLLEHTKTWRDSWSDILVNQTRLADSFHDVYQTIPRTGDSTIPPEPTPPEIMRRVALLHTSYNELKDDMLDEVAKVETMLVQPLGECRVRDPIVRDWGSLNADDDWARQC